MATHCALPIELVGQVAAFTGTTHLLSLARVSRAFKIEAARALYGSVSLRNTASVRHFARTLRDQPCLAGLVRSLSIDIHILAANDLHSLKLDQCRNLRHLFISTGYCPHGVYDQLPDSQLLSFQLSTAWLHFDDVDNFLRRQRRLIRVSFDGYSKLEPRDLPCLRSLEAPFSTVIQLGRDCVLEEVTVLGTVEGQTSFRTLVNALPSCLKKLTVTLEDGSFQNLGQLAQRLPCLETLVLCNVIPDDLETIATAALPPSFPRLRAFEILLYTVDKPDVSGQCNTFFTNWKKNAAPMLQYVRVLVDHTGWTGVYVHCEPLTLIRNRQ